MSNYDKDPDFLDLLAAWHENKTLSPTRRRNSSNDLKRRNLEIGIG